MTNRKISHAYNSQGSSLTAFRRKILLLVAFSICILVSQIEAIHSIFKRINSSGANSNDDTPQCLLKNAYEQGDFVVYSHRSYVSNSDKKYQPSCRDALSQLHDIGVNHLDLDLVLDENNTQGNDHPTIYVSHPMEFKNESSYYSPCAMTPLDELITLLNNVYGQGGWFFSLEPKASWGRSEKEIYDMALVDPIQIMSDLLKILDEFKMQKSQCAVIVDVNTISGTDETHTFEQLLNHCQLFVGRRKTDILESTLDTGVYRYDKIMPTIEFHPDHEGHIMGLTVPSSIQKDSIFWTVDDVNELLLAASFAPSGIVSNRPKEIVNIINSRDWCLQ